MKPYLLVERQVPEFVRAEYPAFVEFLTAYYKWLEEEASVGKLDHVVDVDQTVDGFLQYFRKQIDFYNIAPEQKGNLYLRNVKQLYAAKGSEAGYEFLLKILFNKSSSVIHPWDYVFKPSAGKWKQDVTVIVSAVTGTLASLGGNPVILIDEQGNRYNSFVRNVIRRKDGNVELVVGRIPHTSPLKTVSSTDGLITGNVLTTTTTAKIEKSGQGFRVGQVYRINSYGGSGTLLKIKATDIAGSITAVEIITFGTGYVTDFNITITPIGFIDLGTVGPRITLGGLTYATGDNTSTQNESGSIVKHDYTTGTYANDPTYVGEILGEIRSQEATVYTSTNYASIKFTVGSLCVYPGFYETSESIVGDLMYLQDSFYYQSFSYVTVIDEALSNYSAILREVLHPAGAKHFGNYAISNQFNLSLVVDPSLNLIDKKDAIRDFVDTVEQIVFAFTKVVADNATTTDLFDRTASYNRTFTDTLQGVTENFNRTVSYIRRPTDTVTASESFARVGTFARTLTDTAATSVSLSRIADFERILSDTAQVSEVLSIAGTYYTTLSTTATTIDGGPQFTISPATLLDTVTIGESIQLIPAIPATDSFSAVATLKSFDLNKYPSDPVQTGLGADSGLYMEPYYVEVSNPAPYWQAGYLENERAITN